MAKEADTEWQRAIPKSKGPRCGLKVNINGETLKIAALRTGLENIDHREMMVKQYAVPSDGRQEIKVMLVFRPKELIN